MVTLESSKQKMIETVIAHKDKIVKATNEIIEKLGGYQNEFFDGETAVYVKKRVNQIVSDLSLIGGFCGSREKKLVELAEDLSRHLIAIRSTSLMEDWCIEVNSIIVDFTRVPFRFVKGEFGVSLRNLEGKIKATLKR